MKFSILLERRESVLFPTCTGTYKVLGMWKQLKKYMTDEWVGGWVGGWVDRWTDGWMMGGWTGGGWTDGWTDGWCGRWWSALTW